VQKNRLEGAIIGMLKSSIGNILGIPVARSAGIVKGVSATEIWVGDDVYDVPVGLTSVVAAGDSIVVDEHLTDGVNIFDERNSNFFVDVIHGKDCETVFHFDDHLASIQNYELITGGSPGEVTVANLNAYGKFSNGILVPAGKRLRFDNRIDSESLADGEMVTGSSVNDAALKKTFRVIDVVDETHLEIDELSTITSASLDVVVSKKLIVNPKQGTMMM